MTSKHIPGSIKNKIVNSDLQEERDKCAFDRKEMQAILHGGKDKLALRVAASEKMAKHPELANHHHFYDMTRDEKQTDLWRRNMYVHNNIPELYYDWVLNKYPYHAVSDHF